VLLQQKHQARSQSVCIFPNKAMIYQLIEIKTGKQVDYSQVCNKWFKRALSRLNRES
jgi:hypothetical protein